MTTSGELTLRDYINDRVEEMGESVLLMDGFDEAIVGIGQRINMPAVAIYNYDKMVSHLMTNSKMEYEEAVEYIEFNCSGAWVGEKTPIIMAPITINIIDDEYEDLIDVLWDEYMGVGATHREAIATIWDDFHGGKMDEFMEEQSINKARMIDALCGLTARIAHTGLHVAL